MKTRILLKALLAGSVVAAGVPVHAQAPSWPSRSVKIIVPFSAGTAADIVARQLGKGLGDAWGQGVVVENVAGAGGNIGAGLAAKATPDGYTLLMLGINHVINPSLYKEVPYDLSRDFRPVARVAVAPLAIVANSELGVFSIRDLVAIAKAKPNGVRYGSGGNGSVTHLALELLKSQAGIQMMHVPYKSVAPMLTDILSGQVDIGAPAAASVVPYAKGGGRLRVLAVTTAQRTSAFPNIPTVAESGFAGYDVSAWNGLLAPIGTPAAIVEKINADITRVAHSEEFVKLLQAQAMDVSLLGPSAFSAFLRTEQDKWSRLVKDSGAKLD